MAQAFFAIPPPIRTAWLALKFNHVPLLLQSRFPAIIQINSQIRKESIHVANREIQEPKSEEERGK